MEQEVKAEHNAIRIAFNQTSTKASGLKSLCRRLALHRMVIIGSSIVLLLTLIAVAAPIISTYDPTKMSISDRLQEPDAAHWFGTDEFGRDLFSRVIYGSRVSMQVGFFVVLITSVCGILFGIFSAFYKPLDNIIMRVNDGLMAFPEILLAIAIVAALGPGKFNVIIALSVVYTPLVARVIRSVAIVEREKTYVEAISVLGASSWRIMFKHILPNCLSPYIIQITFIFAHAIIVEASLSFLGAGTPPDIPSWGNILNDGMSVMREAWWVMAFPGVFVVLVVLGLNLLGDGLRDMLDPSLNKKK